MADAVDSKSAGETRVGSTPTFGTIKLYLYLIYIWNIIYFEENIYLDF